jgi:serine/threonine protein phosphatase PrpC
VDLLTIGAFARASGLTAKALRLYDDMGLLVPAAVDPESGYRLYEPAQLDRARLIARLRRIGMPLAEAASTAAVDALRPLELAEAPATELLAMLADAAAEADRAVRAGATADHQPVTTLTAILRAGSRLALVHVGDTRAYLLRGGELAQLTQDHTYVQSLVDRGALSREEAAAHPQRPLLVRALGAGDHVEADLALRTGLAGDRYLLCSDGLSAYVDRSAVEAALAEPGSEPERVAQRLVDLAYAAGAPDNIACVVADLVAR